MWYKKPLRLLATFSLQKNTHQATNNKNSHNLIFKHFFFIFNSTAILILQTFKTFAFLSLYQFFMIPKKNWKNFYPLCSSLRSLILILKKKNSVRVLYIYVYWFNYKILFQKAFWRLWKDDSCFSVFFFDITYTYFKRRPKKMNCHY